MEIINKYSYGELSLTELEDFEKANAMLLPPDYKIFLLKFNGGTPVPNRNIRPATYVTYILGMHNGEYFASLYKHIDMFKNRLPYSTFPIATDPFGNLFIISIHPESYGHIYFWDHEGEPKNQDGNYTDNCYFVSNSFTEFVNNLVE